jgi:hypothetical protein
MCAGERLSTLTGLPALRSLSLMDGSIGEDCLAHVGRCTKLTRLELQVTQGCHRLSEAALMQLIRLHQPPDSFRAVDFLLKLPGEQCTNALHSRIILEGDPKHQRIPSYAANICSNLLPACLPACLSYRRAAIGYEKQR